MWIKIKDYLVCISLFLITLSGSSVMVDCGGSVFLEYCGYAILLPMIFILFLCNRNSAEVWRKACLFLVLVFLMSIGFLIQELSIKRKVILMFTVIGMCSITVLADDLLDSLQLIRAAAYSILAAVCVAAALAYFSGGNIWHEIAVPGGGIGGITLSLNGGIQYKNFFAGDILAVFVGIFLYCKYEKRKLIDLVVLSVLVICLILSNSRGGLILFASFLLAHCYGILRLIKPSHRHVFLACIVIAGLGLVIVVFDKVLMNIPTFAIRFRGLLNYLDYFKDDPVHLLFGSAELVYDQEESYVMAVRLLTGKDGSGENAWLNIMIKSGLLGATAYIVLLCYFFGYAGKCEDWRLKSSIVAIAVMLCVSSLVEAYIQSVHHILGVYSYLAIYGLNATDKSNISRTF